MQDSPRRRGGAGNGRFPHSSARDEAELATAAKTVAPIGLEPYRTRQVNPRNIEYSICIQ